MVPNAGQKTSTIASIFYTKSIEGQKRDLQVWHCMTKEKWIEYADKPSTAEQVT